MTRKSALIFTLLLAYLIANVNTQAKQINVATSTALSGPAMELGKNMKLGMDIYFKHINSNGGIHGNTIRLIAFDDQYEPYLAKKNMLLFARDPDILAVLGNVGTPTASVTVPIANDAKILLFGAFTGAGILRKTPPDRYVINYRASYAEETATMIEALLSANVLPDEIAFFTQNDSYGDAGFRGAVKELEYQGFKKQVITSIPHGRYTHNQVNITPGLETILASQRNIKAFIVVGAYQPVAQFIKQAKKYYPDAYFLNVSFVGSDALMAELCKDDKANCSKNLSRVIVTQVTPHFNANLPAAREYRTVLKKYAPETKPSFVSFEGFLVAKIFVEALKHTGRIPTREGLINALESLSNSDIGIDFPIFFSKIKHQASDQVWPTILVNGKHEMFDWANLKHTNKRK